MWVCGGRSLERIVVYVYHVSSSCRFSNGVSIYFCRFSNGVFDFFSLLAPDEVAHAMQPSCPNKCSHILLPASSAP